MAINIQAELRDKVGSRAARKLRAAGRIPCSIQSTTDPVVSLSIDEAEFLAARRKHEHLFDISLGKDVHPAVVRELQWDYLTDSIIHVEFQGVVRGVELESEVAVVFIGVPKGGVLNVLADHVTIKSIPSKIPDSVEFKVGELEDGMHVSAGELEMPEGCTLVSPEDLQVAVVSGAGGGEALDAEGDDADPDSVEVIGEKKDED
ncbi:MAG: 50S ribosomal protein L25 [Planctomycetota bacterium]|nr:50S ribosomal protein L25 [Planctomycetota bacterium]